MDVHHGLNGNRAVMVERPDHSRVFAERGRPGYVQRPYSYHGHDFARRTYFYHGRAYSHFYHGYAYRGVYLNVYAPGFYFRPAFYGWAYNPWAVPIAFAWGWGGESLVRLLRLLLPAVSGVSLGRILADGLHDFAGSAGRLCGASGRRARWMAHHRRRAGLRMLTPEVKQQIADEVRNQLALENQEAAQNAQQQDVDPGSSGIARMLSDGRPHVFVVGSALDVVDASQTECALSDGDVLALNGSAAG